jgi:hypothetical protein
MTPQDEIARAREIWRTHETLKDKENTLKLIKGSVKWYGPDGVRRIHAYFKEFMEGKRE